jgi:hypothetical protein
MSRKKMPTPISVPIEMPDDLPIIRDNSELMFSQEEVVKKSSKGVGAVVVHHVVTFLQILMVLALGAWSYVTYKNTELFVAPEPGQRNALEPYLVDAQIQRLDQALRVYEALNEKFPVTLDVLVEEGLLEPSDLDYPASSIYRYQRFGEGFKLEGPRTQTNTSVSQEDALIFDEQQ